MHAHACWHQSSSDAESSLPLDTLQRNSTAAIPPGMMPSPPLCQQINQADTELPLSTLKTSQGHKRAADSQNIPSAAGNDRTGDSLSSKRRRTTQVRKFQSNNRFLHRFCRFGIGVGALSDMACLATSQELLTCLTLYMVAATIAYRQHFVSQRLMQCDYKLKAG